MIFPIGLLRYHWNAPSKESEFPPTPGCWFFVYQTEDGKLNIIVRFEGETVWLRRFLDFVLMRVAICLGFGKINASSERVHLNVLLTNCLRSKVLVLYFYLWPRNPRGSSSANLY